MNFQEEQVYLQYCTQIIQELKKQPHDYRLKVYLVSDPTRYHDYCKRFIKTMTGNDEQLFELIQKLETDIPAILREYIIDSLALHEHQ
jgi:hypothetical protein